MWSRRQFRGTIPADKRRRRRTFHWCLSLVSVKCDKKKKENGLDAALVVVCPRHDELAAHLVQLVPAHKGRAVRRVGVGARAEAKLVVVDVEHPLRDRLVKAVNDGGRDIPAHRIPGPTGSMRIQLPSGVIGRDIQLREVAKPVYLDVEVGLEERYTTKGSVWDNSGVVAREGTPRDFESLERIQRRFRDKGTRTSVSGILAR